MASLAAGAPNAGAVANEAHPRHAVTADWHQQDILSTIAGSLMIAAAPALLFRGRRLFLALATGVVGIRIAQWALERPHLNLPHGTPPLVDLLNACLPGPLIGRRSPVAA